MSNSYENFKSLIEKRKNILIFANYGKVMLMKKKIYMKKH